MFAPCTPTILPCWTPVAVINRSWAHENDGSVRIVQITAKAEKIIDHEGKVARIALIIKKTVTNTLT